MDNIVQKIMQPIFVFGNFVNQNEKRKMGWKAHLYQEFTLIFFFQTFSEIDEPEYNEYYEPARY